MEKYFEEFVQKYDMNIPKLNYKYHHSYRVMNFVELLTKNKQMIAEDIKLAKCIGLLHDIGRFIQYEEIGEFNDLLLDHGDIGSTYLEKTDALSKCHIAPKDYQIVYKAIKNHNKLTIDPSLNKRELLYSELIRDADKLDILNAFSNKKIIEIINENSCNISENVKHIFFKEKSVPKDVAKNKNDKIIIVFSFIFDINDDIAFNIIKTNDYYNKIYKRLKNKEIFKPYIEYINKYINERTN